MRGLGRACTLSYVLKCLYFEGLGVFEWIELFWLVGLFESYESFVLFELFRGVRLCLFELRLFESW